LSVYKSLAEDVRTLGSPNQAPAVPLTLTSPPKDEVEKPMIGHAKEAHRSFRCGVRRVGLQWLTQPKWAIPYVPVYLDCADLDSFTPHPTHLSMGRSKNSRGCPGLPPWRRSSNQSSSW